MPKGALYKMVAVASALALVSGCANHLPQRSENEQRFERTLRGHTLLIDIGEPSVLETPQRKVRVFEQKYFDVTEYEVTRRYDRYTPYQGWREIYEVPFGAVTLSAGVAANLVNVVLLGAVPQSVTHGWIQYGMDGLNPFMNVQSNGRSQQNLAGVDEVRQDQREEVTNLPWANRPLQISAANQTYTLMTDRNGSLNLNLLDSPFPDSNLSAISNLHFNVKADDSATAQATLPVSQALRNKLDEAHTLIYDDLEDDEINHWVYRVKRLSELGMEPQANELEQSLIELTRNDRELQTEFINALRVETGRHATDAGFNR
jgi:hypothetical protein